MAVNTPPSNAAPSAPSEAGSPVIAATPKGYTDPGGMLRACRLGWRCEEITCQQLADPVSLARYHAVLLASSITCAQDEIVRRASYPLREWVERGGVLWGCDWSLLFLEAAFPEHVKLSEARADGQTVRAVARDPALSGCLRGLELSLDYSLDNWRILDGAPKAQVSACLVGDVVVESRRLSDQLLMTSFTVGEGHVVASTMGLEAFPRSCREQVLGYLVRRGRLHAVQAPPPPEPVPAAPPASTAGPPTFALRVTLSDGKTSVHKLDDRPLKVGRAKSNDLRVHDRTVSNKHCTFQVKQGRLYVEPRHPTNPVTVDGSPIDKPTELKSGACVSLGTAGTVVRIEIS